MRWPSRPSVKRVRFWLRAATRARRANADMTRALSVSILAAAAQAAMPAHLRARSRRMCADAQWLRERLHDLPPSWQRRIWRTWEKARGGDASDFVSADLRVASNGEARDAIERLERVKLRPDMTDGELRVRAAELADICMRLGQAYQNLSERRAFMERLLTEYGIDAWRGEADELERRHECCALPALREATDGAAIARMTSELWWRGALRKLHASQFEAAAIALGFVNKDQGLYVSEETLQRRTQQLKRNADLLEGMQATNEDGYSASLAELAAKGVANREIRRAELMTRIAGFEVVARELGHAGEFITVTCPSRMHKFTTSKRGRAVPNRKYDETKPRQAQDYLCHQWSLLRSWLDRRGVQLYGFRIAEPHHAGTPHWHLLVFCEPGKQAIVRQGFRLYFLHNDSPQENGAQEHRVRFVSIDWSKGTAAGYIAKYVSKNIDGYRVEKDLHGNDCMTASRRVDAWAANWHIRQFQQVGGPPIGVWRELRRVDAVPADAPEFMHRAHNAVNRTVNLEAGGVKSASFAAYIRAQGGVHVRRTDMPIRLTRVPQAGVTRYGEAKPPRVDGVECSAWETYRDGIVPDKKRLTHWFVPSVRHVWIVARRAVAGAVGDATRAARGAWTRVNNCTRPDWAATPESSSTEQIDREASFPNWPGGREPCFR